MNLCPFRRGAAPLPALAIAGLVAGCAPEPSTTAAPPAEAAARASRCFQEIVASHAELRREIEAKLEFDPAVLDRDPVRLAEHGEALQALADDDARYREWLAAEGRGEVLACLEELGRVALAAPGPDGPDVPPPPRPILAAGAPPAAGERDEEPPDGRFQCNGRPCNCKAVVVGSAVAWDTPSTDRVGSGRAGYHERVDARPGQQDPGFCDSFLGERWRASWAKDLGRVPYRDLGARIHDFLLEGTSGRVARNARELGFTSSGGLLWISQWFPRWCELMTPRFAGRRMLTMKMAWKLVPRVVPGPGGWVDNRENVGAFPWPTEPAEGQEQRWYGASCPENIVVRANVEPQLSFGLSATARVDVGPPMGIVAQSASNYAARASGRLTCFGSGTIDTNPSSFSIVEAQHTTAFDAIVTPTGCARNLRAESSTTFDAAGGMAGGEGGVEYRQGHTNSQSCAERTARLAVSAVRCNYKATGQALLRLESPALQSAAIRHDTRAAVLGGELSPLMLHTSAEAKPFDTLRVGYALDNLYLHARSTPRLPTDSNASAVASAVIRPLTTDPDSGVPAAFIRFQGQGCSVHDRGNGSSYTEANEIPCQWIGSSGDNPPQPPRYDFVGAQLISTFGR